MSLLDNIAQELYLCNVASRVLRKHWTVFFHVQCCLEPLVAQGFYFCNVVPRVLRQRWTVIFPVQCCPGALGQHCRKILLVQCCPKSIKATLSKNFSCAILSRASWTTLHKDFYLCNVVPRILRRQHWTVFFSVQCCLEPLGQYCTKILPVQCCPKSFRTTLNSIFSSAMLSGISWTILHKDVTCAMLFQE